eukprot:Protomagalhaensia_wolfi_Nauph_80__5957@NODE_798_length_1987_cov_1094_545175_g599_i0_p2_GENE_NODE_798_length_1987_cov_1094_545175_g599_i0NODE_798_length_1987_cov_1094_545175_g599_i0_p2_ORF_typecomplete_len240_score39_70Proteasome/PF00227_26/3e22_NODE_798_length_1987_cov_1094_545175_g599_i051722
MFEAGFSEPRGGPPPPTLVGASVLGAKFADGVLLASFTNITGVKHYLNLDRIHVIGEGTLVSAAGNHADYQEMLSTLMTKQEEDALWMKGKEKSAFEWRNLAQTLLYKQRTDIKPSWVYMLFAGFTEDRPYLGLVDLYGTAVDGDFFCPGLGQYFAIPDLRKNWKPDISESECRELMMKALKIMVGTLKPVTHQVQFAKITKEGVTMEAPVSIKEHWHSMFFD